jgi:hypothetical protein
LRFPGGNPFPVHRQTFPELDLGTATLHQVAVKFRDQGADKWAKPQGVHGIEDGSLTFWQRQNVLQFGVAKLLNGCVGCVGRINEGSPGGPGAPFCDAVILPYQAAPLPCSEKKIMLRV